MNDMFGIEINFALSGLNRIYSFISEGLHPSLIYFALSGLIFSLYDNFLLDIKA